MVITLVIDQYGVNENGTSMTAQCLANVLSAHGHRVKILGGVCKGEGEFYQTGVNRLPVLYNLCASQGMLLGKADRRVIKEACAEADVVHFFMPFALSSYTKKYCDNQKIPSTAAFHVQPENISSTLRLGKVKWVNDLIYARFRKFYNRFSHVHCPSRMIESQLLSHGYTAKTHVISNGISATFRPLEVKKPPALKDKFVILMVGRLSAEKRQDVIIRAVKKSKYSDQIQIVFAGKGPRAAYLKRLSRGLKNEVIFAFYRQDELVEVENYADLYVHASDAETEAIGCMEAFACGAVPVISDSPLAATGQFALTKKNLFKAGNADSLCARIDYWIEHPEEKAILSKRYIAYAERFRVERCAAKLERVLLQEANKKKIAP
jgi:glycosyltransferase involved in cell wall biosynthesis